MRFSVSDMPSDASRLIAIGDVHGCVHALDAILDAIGPGPNDTFVFLGDLIDQGRESREVLDRIVDLKKHCSVVLIQGNHEEMLQAATGNEQALRYWESCGGVATLNSYRFGGKLADIPEAHWRLLEECRPYFETEGYLFTHANYTPDEPMDLQPGYQLRWALFDASKMEPHCSGKPVFVGHTEQAEVLDLGFATCIDTGCWRYGWLTAIEVSTKQTWQASRWGVLREEGEASQGSCAVSGVSEGGSGGGGALIGCGQAGANFLIPPARCVEETVKRASGPAARLFDGEELSHGSAQECGDDSACRVADSVRPVNGADAGPHLFAQRGCVGGAGDCGGDCAVGAEIGGNCAARSGCTAQWSWRRTAAPAGPGLFFRAAYQG